MKMSDLLNEAKQPKQPINNPVAKNSNAAIGGGASGTHKNPKRAEKIPRQAKHKKSIPMDESPIEMDPAEPMNPTIYGHQGVAPAKLKTRMLRASSQLKELAQRANSDDALTWEGIARNFEELAMNIEQIRHGIQELANLRKKGGRNSRGIDKHIGECEFCGESHEIELDERGKASRALCTSGRPDSDLGASNLASCKSQGLRARDGNKSHLIGHGKHKTRITVGGKKIKGKTYGGPLPDYGTRKDQR